MERWKHVRVHSCQVLGILLIFLVGFGSCIISSSFGSCEVGGHASNFGSTNQNLNIQPYLEKYIAKLYFDKYNSLLDSDFQDFVAHELCPGSCELLDDLNLVTGLSVQQRALIGDGSHRHLSSSIRFNIPELVAELPIPFCEAIIIEKLPHGIFADPFELQHLLQRGVFMDAAVFGDTNLELPSVRSNRSLVEVHMDVELNNTFSRRKDGFEINIDLPLHIRYPPLEESGYSSIELGAPEIFMRCSVEAKLANQSCLLMFKDDDVALGNDPVVWRVPCGIKAHARAVSIVSFSLAILSTLSIVLTSVCYSNTKWCKSLKQS